MTTEEKAKAYDEAIKRIKGYVTDEYGCTRLRPSDIFPELAEIKDEEIRKAIIEALQFEFVPGVNIISGKKVTLEEAIAYLEKQGEQKPVENGQYQKGFEDALESVKKNWRDYFKPQDVVDIYNEGIKQGIASVEQKPVEWSEEDERMVDSILWHVEDSIGGEYSETYDKISNWLKSLRPQKQWKPSEEQIIDLENTIDNFIPPSYKEIRVSLQKLLIQLKAL